MSNRARALMGLYNNSQPFGMGFLAPGCDRQMTLAEAEDLVVRHEHFDYVRGRLIKTKIPFSATSVESLLGLNFALYDRDLGARAGYTAVLDGLTQPDS